MFVCVSPVFLPWLSSLCFFRGLPRRLLHPGRLRAHVRWRRAIDRDHGVHVFPDTHAAGQGKKPQHVYSVRFTARELWGNDASARDAIYIDLWDDYLDPA